MECKVYRMKKYNGKTTKAFVDLIFDNTLIVKGYNLVEGKEGLFLGNPSEKNKDGKYYDIVRFNNKEEHKKAEELVIEEYYKNNE